MVNKSKHTPGPWRVSDTFPNTVIHHKYGDGNWGMLCRVQSVIHGDAEQANAQLIAAAPQMYTYIEKQANMGDTEAVKLLEAINNGR